MAGRTGEHREVTIQSIGARGDGIAKLGASRLFVPLTVPGDRLYVRIIGRRGDDLVGAPVEWLALTARAEPPCPHFGDCGGCQLQHLAAAQYRAWKREQVQMALARQGLDRIRVEPLVNGRPGARRRVRLAFEWRSAACSLGFRERSGRRIVDVEVCPIATPGLVALLPALRILLARLDLARRGGELQITASASGIDLEIIGAPPSLADREALAAFAQAEDLARISWCAHGSTESEPIVQRRAPTALFGQVQVELPPGAFLQATEAAEGAIRHAIGRAIGEAGRIADLFAGCGTFSLPLAAAGCTAHAIERDPAMLAALEAAARRAGLAGRITTERRDLQRAPLEGAELERFDALVVDPPRVGARPQAEALAASQVGQLAMVSCNPATFARDARILIGGGYQCQWVQPIDAFLWSSRIELVGAFERRVQRRRPPLPAATDPAG
jgi:23S rRNA (uracil1939-C5)-methyltransferase